MLLLNNEEMILAKFSLPLTDWLWLKPLLLELSCVWVVD